MERHHADKAIVQFVERGTNKVPPTSLSLRTDRGPLIMTDPAGSNMKTLIGIYSLLLRITLVYGELGFTGATSNKALKNYPPIAPGTADPYTTPTITITQSKENPRRHESSTRKLSFIPNTFVLLVYRPRAVRFDDTAIHKSIVVMKILKPKHKSLSIESLIQRTPMQSKLNTLETLCRVFLLGRPFSQGRAR